KYTELRFVALYGGVGPKTQIETIKKGVDIIVATPGRFLEIYAKRVIIPKKIKHVVLDECDRMMDMGFWPQLREIQEKLPQKKQQLLFSATFPERVERIADNFLLFPSRVEVTPQATPATTVEQRVYMVPNFKTKLNLLMHLLEGDEMKRVMVFVRTKADATSMGKFMERSNVGEIRFLHSNIGQNSRMNAIKDFKEGNVRILVSTDVTARGIDVFEVSHVVNFQVPGHYEDYVHRIGRTGRAFKTGVAISFVDQSEEYHLTNIQKIIRQTIPVFEIPEVVHIEKTEPEEKQEQAREIDRQKRLDDPDFKGAFHEKKSLQAKMKFKQERDKKQRRSR
ncbi:MAG: DEAD/DEAH box helicase, partial [Flavobacteriales bacterium]|nr:DEAD/DEAH box helicase [Flavobacteriales bacterium]